MTTRQHDDRAARGQVEASAAEVYEAFFVPALFGQWTDRMLDTAGVGPGDRMLDVGCGTGILARSACERVGPQGRVAGVDPNPGMLTVARRAAPAVTWREAVAEALPFDDAEFDHALCQFALMFFDDRNRAIDEMARVVRPGGSITVATWASVDASPGYAAMVGLIRQVVGDRAAEALLAPFSVGDPVALRELVRRAAPDVSVATHAGTAQFDSLDAWLHTDIRGWTLSDMVDDGTFDELRRAAHRELGRFTGRDGHVRFAAPALIATVSTPLRVP